jgi:hypothetical protein
MGHSSEKEFSWYCTREASVGRCCSIATGLGPSLFECRRVGSWKYSTSSATCAMAHWGPSPPHVLVLSGHHAVGRTQDVCRFDCRTRSKKCDFEGVEVRQVVTFHRRIAAGCRDSVQVRIALQARQFNHSCTCPMPRRANLAPNYPGVCVERGARPYTTAER